MSYRDPEAQKKAKREWARKHRGSTKGSINEENVEPNTNDVEPKIEPGVEPSVEPQVTPPAPDTESYVEKSAPFVRLAGVVADLEKRIEALEGSVRGMEEAMSEGGRVPKSSRGPSTRGEMTSIEDLPFSRSRQAAGRCRSE